MGTISHDNTARTGSPSPHRGHLTPPTHGTQTWPVAAVFVSLTKALPHRSPDPCPHPLTWTPRPPATAGPSRAAPTAARSLWLTLSTPHLPPACVSVTDTAFIPYDPTPNFGDYS